jgi:hypothetical protein
VIRNANNSRSKSSCQGWFDRDLSNVQIKDSEHIIFDEYVAGDDVVNELKSERDKRRSEIDNLREVMEFDTSLLYLNLKDYFDEYCIAQYFENNPIIGNHTHSIQFVDIPVETL